MPSYTPAEDKGDEGGGGEEEEGGRRERTTCVCLVPVTRIRARFAARARLCATAPRTTRKQHIVSHRDGGECFRRSIIVSFGNARVGRETTRLPLNMARNIHEYLRRTAPSEDIAVYTVLYKCTVEHPYRKLFSNDVQTV